MAQKIITVYTDDLTGEESGEVASHSFSLDGVAYEVDLSPDSYDKLLDALAPFVRVGRKVHRLKTAPRKEKGSRSQESARIREWARNNGYEISARGRVPAEVRAAYQAVN
ncbi:Lsr2 family protein [Streptomyces sp. NPDC093595]|uniref:histone-like nucleoid-structuring protein Lsr2 n=1 Tax=Streptomyces sp. NPDC093595 TaxID=3366045 RepID=UPI00381DA870